MAQRRKKGKSKQRTLPCIEELTSVQETTYLAEALAQFNLNKYENVSWRVSSPNSFVSGLTGEEGHLKFVDAFDHLCINRFSEREEVPNLLIGWLTLEGNLAGISNLIESADTVKTTLRWSLDDTHWLCVCVQLHEAKTTVVLSTLVTLKPAVSPDVFRGLASHCRRGVVHLIAQRPLGCENCLQLKAGVFANRKVVNMGVANSLPPTRTHSIGVEIIETFSQSFGPVDEVQFPSDVLIDTSKPSGNMKSRIFRFYQWVRSYQDSVLASTLPPLPAKITGLTADLLKFQTKAVQWMLAKEQAAVADVQQSVNKLHPLWQEIHTEGLSPLYYNPYTGRLSLEQYLTPVPPKGGILADEMGLGKTVEMLTLILVSKWPVDCINSTNSLVEYYRSSIPQEELVEEEGIVEEEIEGGARYSNELSNQCVKSEGETVAMRDCEGSSQEGETVAMMDCEGGSQEGETVAMRDSGGGSQEGETVAMRDCEAGSQEGEMVVMRGSGGGSQEGETVAMRDCEGGSQKGETVAMRDCEGGSQEGEMVAMRDCEGGSQEGEMVAMRDCEAGSQEGQTMAMRDCEGGSQEGCSSLELCRGGGSMVSPDDGILNLCEEGLQQGEHLGNEEVMVAVVDTLKNDKIIRELPVTEEMEVEENGGNAEEEREASVNGKEEEEEVVIEEDDKDNVWCLCGALSTDQKEREFVQCELCFTWQHSKCVEFDSSKKENFICVRCLLKRPISCGSTLIIVPESLLHQWLEEIAKHTDIESLRLMVYWGVSKRYINPLHIIVHDIVLVTYETLRHELDRVHHHEFTLMLRKRKVSAYPPSPLLAINWWRVCLDEAQTVESVNAKAAEMTHKLTAINRWCVTGTPIQKDLQDLYGLVYFLGYRPHYIRQWWHELVWQPYRHGNPRPMIALFSELMWRKSKEDVADELSLPAIKEEIHWLTFSAVEAYFYKKQEELCRNTFINVVRDLSECMDYTLSELHRSLITKLLTPLHTLRQACCHPQLVRRGYINLNPSKNSYLSMADLLKKLVSQAKQEGREDLRQLVAALNGQAAVYIIMRQFELAVEKYREAMQAWKTHEENFICDRMQRIHTMENLSSLLEEGHSSKSRAISDSHLMREAAVLRSEYMKTQENQVKGGVQSLSIAATHVRRGLEKFYHSHSMFLGGEEDTEAEEESLGSSTVVANDVPAATQEDSNTEEEEQAVEEEGDEEEMKDENLEEEERSSDNLSINVPHFNTKDSAKPPSNSWWSSVIVWTKETSRDTELLSLMETELHSSTDYLQQLTFFDFKELSGLQLAVVNHLDKMQTQRTEVLRLVNILSEPGPLSETLIKAASRCHLKTNRMNPSSPCIYCETECEIRTYEGLLFSRYSTRSEENHNDASRSMSVCERLLRSILSFIKTKRAPHQLCIAGSRLVQYFEALRKEFKYILGLWMKTEQRVRACDELSMAATRLKLLDNSMDREDQFILLENDLHPKLLEFSADVKMAHTRLQKSHGQLVYLQNLSRAETNSEDIVSCPICTTELKDQWSVLPCGHCLCMECLNTLISRHSSINYISQSLSQQQQTHFHNVFFTCPMCRERVSSVDINYVRSDDFVDTSDSQLIGSYSTKITAVVGTLKMIKSRDPGAKALVFSSTFEVLKLISHALKENDIEFTFLRNKSDYKTNLQSFKSSPTLNVLLMPMSSGSKGLNLTEATHVLLVEPSLNIGAELQAIGRIHRVGQTKVTTVHRFYICNTIEESIREMLSNTADVSKFIGTSNISESDCNLTVAELMEIIIG